LVTLLIAITLTGLILPIEIDRRRRASAVDELRQLGGKVSTRQLIPGWATQRIWLPSFVLADDAKILFQLQPDGTLAPTNSGDAETLETPISVGRIRALAMRAGLSLQKVKLGVMPTSSTPHTLTSRVAADFREAGFGSAWEDEPPPGAHGDT
jgi:hypothetical protein